MKNKNDRNLRHSAPLAGQLLCSALPGQISESFWTLVCDEKEVGAEMKSVPSESSASVTDPGEEPTVFTYHNEGVFKGGYDDFGFSETTIFRKHENESWSMEPFVPLGCEPKLVMLKLHLFHLLKPFKDRKDLFWDNAVYAIQHSKSIHSVPLERKIVCGDLLKISQDLKSEDCKFEFANINCENVTKKLPRINVTDFFRISFVGKWNPEGETIQKVGEFPYWRKRKYPRVCFKTLKQGCTSEQQKFLAYKSLNFQKDNEKFRAERIDGEIRIYLQTDGEEILMDDDALSKRLGSIQKESHFDLWPRIFLFNFLKGKLADFTKGFDNLTKVTARSVTMSNKDGDSMMYDDTAEDPNLKPYVDMILSEFRDLDWHIQGAGDSYHNFRRRRLRGWSVQEVVWGLSFRKELRQFLTVKLLKWLSDCLESEQIQHYIDNCEAVIYMMNMLESTRKVTLSLPKTDTLPLVISWNGKLKELQVKIGSEAPRTLNISKWSLRHLNILFEFEGEFFPFSKTYGSPEVLESTSLIADEEDLKDTSREKEHKNQWMMFGISLAFLGSLCGFHYRPKNLNSILDDNTAARKTVSKKASPSKKENHKHVSSRKSKRDSRARSKSGSRKMKPSTRK